MASDSFTNSDGTALETHDSNWVMQGTGGSGVSWEINSNQANPDDTSEGCAVYTETLDDDQFCETLLAAMTTAGSGRLGPACRCTASSTKTGYIFFVRDFGATTRTLAKIVAGSTTTLDSDGTSPSAGEVLRIEANGTTIRSLVDTVEVFSVTDSEITGGQGGMYSNNHSGTAKALDDFLTGALGGGGSLTIPVAMNSYRQRHGFSIG